MSKFLAASLKLLKENIDLKEGESVAVVTDRKKCAIFPAVCKAVEQMGGKLTALHITSHRTHSQPLPKLKKKFYQSNVIIGITDKSITHCPETTNARKAHGARVISMVQVDEKLFLKAMVANQKRIDQLGKKLSRLLKKSRLVTVHSRSGSSFTVKTVKSAVSIDDGDSSVKGAVNNLPYGEVAMLPISVANGTIAIDFARDHITPRDHAKVTVKDGKIVDFTETARSFVNYLKRVDGNKALKIVELGLGINPAHKNLMFCVIHDEKIIGSVHVAFGGYGSKRKCKIHEDVIILKPTVWFDSKMVIRNGKIL